MFYNLETNEELDISSQYFSGTDKCKDPREPGIVFPLACNDSVKDMLNVSSIIDHHKDNIALCKHTEARIANADTEKKEVVYKETEVVSLEYKITPYEIDLLINRSPSFVYQSDNKIKPLLKDKLNNVIDALYSNDMPFNSIIAIDNYYIEEKSHNFSALTTNDCKTDKLEKELIDIILFDFGVYIESLDKAKQKKVVKYALDKYSNDEKTYYKSLFTSKLWGREIDKVRKNKDFEALFKKDDFLSLLATKIMDVIYFYDLGMNNDRSDRIF